MYVLDIDTKGTKKWHPIFHPFLLNVYYWDDKNLHLWQEEPRPSPDYELWDDNVENSMAILDSRQVQRRNKHICLMDGYSSYEYKWINVTNLSLAKRLIEKFEDRKALEAKATKTTWKATKRK